MQYDRIQNTTAKKVNSEVLIVEIGDKGQMATKNQVIIQYIFAIICAGVCVLCANSISFNGRVHCFNTKFQPFHEFQCAMQIHSLKLVQQFVHAINLYTLAV